MPRVKRGFKARRRRNRVLKHAKGFYGAKSRTFRSAVAQVRHAWLDAFRHRRERKRDFRRLWIARINASARDHGVSYSRLVHALHSVGIAIDRKVLADLAVSDPKGFAAVVDATKS